MYSPFHPLLRTNIVPSGRERHQIRDLLDESQVEVDKLTQEITELQSLLDTASKRRADLQDFMEEHTALLSPARRLPDDIVRVIFLASLPETRNSALVSEESPLLVSQICSAWRNIALSTPRLWAAIYIVVPGEAKLGQLTEQVGLWLTRSGAVPLSISLRLSGTAFSLDGPCNILSLLQLLVGESRRWCHVDITLPPQTTDCLVAMLSPGEVPFLRSIALRRSPRRRYFRAVATPDSAAPLSFLGTPSLVSVTISSSIVDLQSPISWGTLRHLSIERGGLEHPFGVTHAVALTILSRCQRLESCELSLVRKALDSTGSSSGSPGIPHFTLSHLNSLTLIIHVQAIGDHTRFFHHASLPALRSLHCQGAHDNGPSLRQSFLPDDLSNIESLTWDVQAFPRELVLEALSELHGLRELRMLKEPFVPQMLPVIQIGGIVMEPTPAPPLPEWLRYLHVPESEPDTSHLVVCPRLQNLELMLFRPMPDADIVQLIRSRYRAPSVTSLERFTCMNSNTAKPESGVDVESQLQEQVAGGLELVVHWRPRKARMQVVYSALEGAVTV
ncbi:hypothetical protein FB45DRAFT_798197 [Roridomyces roridus]|uniref:F-box domain-containing protein n=1 Tax=Roridomyces roridus TaxID=1738132 RepID=A0AAD7FIH6_9AGAR|nr:hypothetical protein FB45DRAFT_798197 [Roridomyces roridus]